jgi:DNA-binding phage protein
VPGFTEHIPSSNKDLADKDIVRELLLECLREGDMFTFEDVLLAYIRTSAKLSLSKSTKIGRTTLYDLIDPKKQFNPSYETLSKIFEDLAA